MRRTPRWPGATRSALSVAAVGQNVLIGAPLADWSPLDSNTGAAYLFDGVTGNLLHTFHNPEPGEYDEFGSTLLAVGEDILIGAPFDSQDATNAGSVYLFDGETRELLQKFPDLANPTHPDPLGDGEFGGAVAVLDEDHILIASASAGIGLRVRAKRLERRVGPGADNRES